MVDDLRIEIADAALHVVRLHNKPLVVGGNVFTSELQLQIPRRAIDQDRRPGYGARNCPVFCKICPVPDTKRRRPGRALASVKCCDATDLDVLPTTERVVTWFVIGTVEGT